MVDIEFGVQSFQLFCSTGRLFDRTIVDHLIAVNGRLFLQLLNMPVRHETELLSLVNAFQLKNCVRVGGAFQKSHHSFVRCGVPVNIIPFFNFHRRPPYRSGSLRLGEGLAGAVFSAACASFSMTDSFLAGASTTSACLPTSKACSITSS